MNTKFDHFVDMSYNTFNQILGHKNMEANIFLGILAFIGLSLAIGKNAAEKERAQQSE